MCHLKVSNKESKTANLDLEQCITDTEQVFTN